MLSRSQQLCAHTTVNPKLSPQARIQRTQGASTTKNNQSETKQPPPNRTRKQSKNKNTATTHSNFQSSHQAKRPLRRPHVKVGAEVRKVVSSRGHAHPTPTLTPRAHQQAGRNRRQNAQTDRPTDQTERQKDDTPTQAHTPTQKKKKRESERASERERE